MLSFTAKVYMPKSTADMLAKYNLEKGGLVQQVIDLKVIEYCKPYTPKRLGVLEMNASNATQIGSGEVVWKGPYAHYMYYGEVYGPNIPFKDGNGNIVEFRSRKDDHKQPTGRELQYSTDLNPLAGSFWFERMKADHLDDIIKEAQNAAAGKQH